MIIFKKLTFANFLSVGNTPVTVELAKSKTTLIHGTNGSGKSTVLDALCYVLFNKPFRRVNLPQLINTQNRKGLLVEVEFTIGKNNFMVRRGIKKKVFEVWKNGEILDRKAADKDNQLHLEQNILKLSYKSFCQVCILGSANYIPFMSLPIASRRDCIEDFLDIKVFSAMSLLAKERLRSLKEGHHVLKGDISNLDYKKEIELERIDEIKKKAEASTQEIKDDLKSVTGQITKFRELITRLSEHKNVVTELRDRILIGKPNEKTNEIQKVIAKLESKTERLHKDNDFYNKNDSCPTCRQDITVETKSQNIQENNTKILANDNGIVEGKKVIDKLGVKIRILKSRDLHIQHVSQSIVKYQTKLSSLEDTGLKLAKKLKELETNDGSLVSHEARLELLSETLQDHQKRLDVLLEQIADHEVVVGLLKDNGIKTQVVRKYLPVMNKLIRQYLTELDLPVQFKLDEEFNEKVASPMHQDFSYASFSEGQKARIDLALMFTWREIGKLKNSVSTNLLILDEVFSSSLDDTGKELLLALLRYNLPDYNNIIVVDHTLSGDFKQKFDRSIEVNKVKNFSHYHYN